MPFQTPLDKPPYFDRFSTDKKRYHVALKPGVSVQVGELNELQSILRNQIEKFGDAIFERGTIIKGCNFTFYDNYPFVKISDTLLDGVAVGSTSAYFTLFAENDDGLQGYITNTLDGFEGSDVQKTLYINYVNSGSDGATDAFSPGDLLTISAADKPIPSVSVENGSFGFGKSDRLIALSAITVNVSSGTFTNGEYVIQPTTGANVQIVGITNKANSNSVILNIKPVDADLANGSATIDAWSFSMLDDIRNLSNTVFATVEEIIGSGLEGEIDINSIGKVKSVIVTNSGSGYYVVPWVGIQSGNNSSGIGTLELTAKNYFARVRVLSQSNSVGNGYAFGISSGYIYQKGLFLEVDDQVVIINNYENQPNNVSVGFNTVETISTYLTDPELLDNAFIEENELAPGADRIVLNPELLVVNTDVALANVEFFPLVEWNSGRPVIQHHDTTYSIIGDEMARRTSETSGDFVLDPFLCTTDAVTNTGLDSLYYTAVIDPGTAYIAGYRTQTLSNYRLDISKGLDTKIANSAKVSLNYGAYIRIKEVGGLFQFSTGDTIDLYDTTKTFLSNASLAIASNTTPQGTKIGTARIRSMVLESGLPGDYQAVYRLYLFSVSVSAGKNFRGIRSVYYNGTNKGIADVVLQYDPTTTSNIAVLNDPGNSKLIFPSGFDSIKNSNQSVYIYRTIDQTANFANSGVLTKSIAASPNEFYPYSGSLTSGQMLDLYVVPLGNNMVQYTPLTGTLSINTTSANATGTSTVALTDVQAGDYLFIYSNSSQSVIKKVINVVNNTVIVLDSNCSFANGSCSYKRAFPKNVPIPFGARSGLTANVDANGNILTLDLGFAIDTSTVTNTAIAVNIQRTGVTSTSKTVNRNAYVKIRCSNNAATNAGPWCLGVSGAFRLRSVYVGSSTVNTNSTNVTDEFYLETNQAANFNDLSYLHLDPKSSLILTTSDYLLAVFDYFTNSGGGYYDTVSYLHTSNAAQIAALDALPVANLTSAAISWEVPEVVTSSGEYFDLLNCFDFRPRVANTAAPGSNSSNAPVNPAYTLSFGNTADPSNDLKFPLPNSLFTSNVEVYLSRYDDIIIGHDGNISCLKGVPSADPNKRNEPNLPDGCLKLQTINVPAYPNITKNINQQIANQISTRAVNELNLNTRLRNHTIAPVINSNNVTREQPRNYTMTDIRGLDDRLQAVEYYTRLNLLESDITRRVIQSTVDPTQNRFKYGFFVDDFSDYKYSDVTNPQYAATIETVDGDLTLTPNSLPTLASNLLVPVKFVWPLKHVIQQPKPISVNATIINQPSATTPAANTPTTTCNLVSTSVVNAVSVTQNATHFVFWDGKNGPLNQSQSNAMITMSKYSGNVTIYYFFPVDPRIRVWQGNNLTISTASAVAISPAEVATLTANATTNLFWTAIQKHLGFNLPKKGLLAFGAPDKEGWIKQAGKVSWVHNPNNGRNYRIQVEHPAHATGKNANQFFQYMITYPVDATVQACYTVQACQGSTPSVFNGVMHSDTLLNTSSASQSAVVGADTVEIVATGLKPGTTHTFYVDGIPQVTNIKPAGRNFGDPLLTDGSGSVTFAVTLPASWYNKVSSQQISVPLPAKLNYSFKPVLGAAFDGKTVSGTYSLFELKATNSYAFKYIQITMPNKLRF